MKRKTPYVLIEYEDLTGKLYKGNVGEYTYLSPRWGYKRAYRYNQTLYIYLTSQLSEGGWLEIKYFKNANRLEILDSLKKFKETSRRYKKLTDVEDLPARL